MRTNKVMGTPIFLVITVMVMLFSAGPAMGADAKKVAVIPFTMNSPQDLGFLQNGLFDMLSSRLADAGKVIVLDRDTVEKGVEKARTSGTVKGQLNEGKARILGLQMGVDYVLFGSLNHFGESVSLDTRMVDISGKKPSLTFFKQSNNMGDVIPMINTFAGDINQKVFNRTINNELYAGAQQPEQEKAPGSLEHTGFQQGGMQSGFINLQQRSGKGFQTLLKFKGQINAMAAGDIKKDGVVRVVTASDHHLYIHKFEKGRLQVEETLEYDATHRIAGLDIADINHNGYPEIFVTSINIHRNGLQSFVLEYNGKTFVTLTEGFRYYLRVMDNLGGPDIETDTKILVGQRSKTHPFHSDIYIMAPSGNEYVEQRKLQLPSSVSALSLAQGPVTSKEAREHILINEHGRLILAVEGGRVEWESGTKFGGTDHYFLLPRDDVDASFTERAYLNPRLLFYDIGDDDSLEIVVIRNEEIGGGVLGRYKRFSRGNLEILSWNGIAMAPLYKIRPVQGWISDFVIADIDDDGRDELVVSIAGLKKLILNIQKQVSNVISYELE